MTVSIRGVMSSELSSVEGAFGLGRWQRERVREYGQLNVMK